MGLGLHMQLLFYACVPPEPMLFPLPALFRVSKNLNVPCPDATRGLAEYALLNSSGEIDPTAGTIYASPSFFQELSSLQCELRKWTVICLIHLSPSEGKP